MTGSDRRRRPLFLCSGVLCALFVLSFSCAPPAAAFTLDDRVHKTVLDNGIRLLVVERPVSPTVSLYIRHRVGAVDEISGSTGMAHLLEHMMFKGTTTIGTRDYEAESDMRRRIGEKRQRLGEITKQGEQDSDEARKLARDITGLEAEKASLVVSNEIDRLYRQQGGVGLNAATGYDMTTYLVNLPSRAIELWARIESDRLMNPVFREFLPERNVVIEERRQMVCARPEGRLMELFLGTAFLAHPYRRPIIGWESDIPNLDETSLRRFFDDYYVPSGMVIAVVGDVKNEAVVTLVNSYFGFIPGAPNRTRVERHITAEPEQRGERRAHLVYDASPRLLMGFHKPSLPAREDAIFDLIDTVLTSGRSSRLHRSLVTERGLAASVSTASGFPGARYDNLFLVAAQPLDGQDIHELEVSIIAELDRLGRDPLSEDELQKAKNRISTDYLRRLDSNSGMASLLSYFEILTGDYRTLEDYLRDIESVTAQDVMDVASAFFTERNRTVVTLIREETR